MAYKTKAAMQKLQSLVASMGPFKAVEIGEPARPPESPHAAVIIGPEWRITETTLDAPVEERQVTVRLYDRAFQEPTEVHEFLIEELAADVGQKVGTNYQLGDTGGNIRSVEVTRMSVRFGWQEIGRQAGGDGIWYRTADIIVPVIVQDSYTFAAST